MILPHRAVLIQDEWVAGKNEVHVEWQMLTRAEVAAGERSLTLRQDGKTMTLEILEPEQVDVDVRDVSAPANPHDAANPGVRQIRLRTTTAAGGSGRFRVLAFFDGEAPSPASPPLTPLENW